MHLKNDQTDIAATIAFLERLLGSYSPSPAAADPIAIAPKTEVGAHDKVAATHDEFAAAHDEFAAAHDEFAAAVQTALKTIGLRLKNHAKAINRLQDDEGQTRNMVIHCENLIAEAEERWVLALSQIPTNTCRPPSTPVIASEAIPPPTAK